MKTALEQNREDQALGAAWRRCEAALPEDFGFSLRRGLPFDGLYHSWAYRFGGNLQPMVVGATPTEALTALAEALEAR